jgi:uncharacterized coiled-coil protein SlyX
MTRQKLEQLSKAELIEIILQQQTVIAQLQAAVAELQEQLRRLTQPVKDASNTSVPPSQTRKPNRPAGQPATKRCPKPGHEGRSRLRQEPQVIVECRPTSCEQCGRPLPRRAGKLLGTSQVIELPPVRPLVIGAQRLHRRYHKHRQALFTFLYWPDGPPDNNACERALRKSAVHRKVSGGFRTRWGAEAFATLATVSETAAKRGQDALSALTSLLTPGPPPLPLPQPP